MNDNSRRNAELVQQAKDMKLTLAEIKTLLARRPTTYAPLRLLLPQGEN